MKTVFFGDLHGNIQALEACLRSIERSGADRLICLGDLVGWLPFGDRTLDRVRGLGIHVVAGNHDLLVAGVFADHPRQLDRMQATAFNAGILAGRPEALDYLAHLPLVLEYDAFTVVHHSPFLLPAAGALPSIECFGYLDEAALSDSVAAWKRFSTPLIVSGHDHIPALFELADTQGTSVPAVTTHRPEGAGDLCVALRPNARYWIKAGSVGGPYRDGIPLANLVEFDDERQTVTLRRVAYATEALHAELTKHRWARNLPTLQQYAKLLASYAREGGPSS